MAMSSASAVVPSAAWTSWRDVAWPKEHGSWSLAFEPVALGLLAAPTSPGVALAVAIAGGFFARRPMRIAFQDRKPERRRAARRALVLCTVLAALGIGWVVRAAGLEVLPWLAPSIALGAAFLVFDWRQNGREQVAELLGALAFAWLPAVFAALAGWSAGAAAALGVVMVGRSVPTVVTVRSVLRGQKSGKRQVAAALVLSVAASAAGGWLVREGLAPAAAAMMLVLLAVRTFVLLVAPAPTLRASRLGMIEAVLGVLFVAAVGGSWRGGEFPVFVGP